MADAWLAALRSGLAGLGAGLAVAGWAATAGAQAPPAAKASLAVDVGSPINSFFQNVQNLNGVAAIAELTLEGLTRYKVVDGTLQLMPRLATEWTQVGPDKWRFNLRRGVTFSDGRPFTSADVLASVNLLVTYPGTFTPLFNRYKLEAPDDHTVDVTSEVPNENAVPMRFSMVRIFPADLIKQLGAEGVGQNPVGTGPYKVARFVQGSSVSLVPNERWWGTRRPAIQNVSIRYVADPATRISELRAGTADLVDTVPLSLAPTVEQDARFRLIIARTQSRRQLFFNPNSGVTANASFRKAVAHAIDKAELVAVEKRAIPNGGIYSFNEAAYDPAYQAFPYDPEKSIQLLKAAGIRNPVVTLHVRAELPSDVIGAQVIQAQLAAVGITLKIDVGPGADSIPKWTAGQMDGMYYGQMQALYPTEDQLFFTHFSEKSAYRRVTGVPDATPLIDQLRSTTDIAERRRLAQRIQQIVLERDTLWAPMYIEPDLYAAVANLRWEPVLGVKLNFEDAYFE